MVTAQQKLIESHRDKIVGNHRVMNRGINEHYRSFFYFATEICRVWDDKKEFWVDDSYGSVSTTRACSKYRYELKDRGYTEVDK